MLWSRRHEDGRYKDSTQHGQGQVVRCGPPGDGPRRACLLARVARERYYGDREQPRKQQAAYGGREEAYGDSDGDSLQGRLGAKNRETRDELMGVCGRRRRRL